LLVRVRMMLTSVPVAHPRSIESSSASALREPGRIGVIRRPMGMGAFQFVVLASLRTSQLARGCPPRVDGVHRNAVVAQLEVSQGKVVQAAAPPVAGPPRIDIDVNLTPTSASRAIGVSCQSQSSE
jgi:hypothetical protein